MPDHGSPHVESGVKKKIENVVDTETTEKTQNRSNSNQSRCRSTAQDYDVVYS